MSPGAKVDHEVPRLIVRRVSDPSDSTIVDLVEPQPIYREALGLPCAPLGVHRGDNRAPRFCCTRSGVKVQLSGASPTRRSTMCLQS